MTETEQADDQQTIDEVMGWWEDELAKPCPDIEVLGRLHEHLTELGCPPDLAVLLTARFVNRVMMAHAAHEIQRKRVNVELLEHTRSKREREDL